MDTILIIEDALQLRTSIAEVLSAEGFRVIQADNGISGIAMAKEWQPDLILSDIMMPGADGYEVLNSLKLADGQLQYPFIFISALEDRKNVRDGMELGADDYLIKPFTVDELLKAVKVRMEKHRSIETRIKLRIESIEQELQEGISELERRINSQKGTLDLVVAEKAKVEVQLKEKQDQLMQDALRSIEINSTLQEMSAHLTSALQRNNLSEEQRRTLSDLRNRLRNRSILLNNQTVFLFKFEQTYPNFKHSLLLKNPKLKKQDLVLLAATFMQLDTNQLGTILNISSESVRKKRYRLKLKIGLKRDQELTDFIFRLADGARNN